MILRNRLVVLGVSLIGAVGLALPQQVQSSGAVVKCTETTCDHVYSNGHLFVVARGTDVNVVAGGLVDTGHHIFLAVAVKDRSNSTKVDVLPETFTLVADHEEKTKALGYVDPNRAIRSEGGSVGWADFFDRMAAGNATQKTTVQTRGTANYSEYSTDGTVTNGSVSATGTETVRTPDYEAREAARERIAERNASAAQKRQQLANASLKATTITPGQAVRGIVFFEHDKNVKRFTLTVPVNGVNYVFDLPLK